MIHSGVAQARSLCTRRMCLIIWIAARLQRAGNHSRIPIRQLTLNGTDCKRFTCNPRAVYTEHLDDLMALVKRGVGPPPAPESRAP